MSQLEEFLQHHGVRGMKWGVRRDRNRAGGADGKEESTKVTDNRSNLKKKLDSMKRERQWSKVMGDVDKLTTKDIKAASKRIQLENDLKKLSKSSVGTKKDKSDYLRRANMSNDELNRKVNRLRAKESLKKNVKAASQGQREAGAKIAKAAGSVGLKYALNKKVDGKDILNALLDTNNSFKSSRDDVLKKSSSGALLKEFLDKQSKNNNS